MPYPVLAGLLLVAAGMPALAGEKILPPVDKPGHWHTMTHDDATTTSKCVGNPITPLCAVETIRACFVRTDRSLCALAKKDMNGLSQLFSGSTKPTPGITEKYRITGARILVDWEIPPDRREGKWAWKVGDVQIDLKAVDCYHGKCQKEIKREPPKTYDVRKIDERWVVIDWDTPRW